MSLVLVPRRCDLVSQAPLLMPRRCRLIAVVPLLVLPPMPLDHGTLQSLGTHPRAIVQHNRKDLGTVEALRNRRYPEAILVILVWYRVQPLQLFSGP